MVLSHSDATIIFVGYYFFQMCIDNRCQLLSLKSCPKVNGKECAGNGVSLCYIKYTMLSGGVPWNTPLITRIYFSAVKYKCPYSLLKHFQDCSNEGRCVCLEGYDPATSCQRGMINLYLGSNVFPFQTS